MHPLTYRQTVTMDRSNFLQRLISLLTEHQIHYCVIGGQAVNAYVEPVVSLDLDLVVAVEQLEQVEELPAKEFLVQRFPHRLNVYAESSALRVQIQTDPRYADFGKRIIAALRRFPHPSPGAPSRRPISLPFSHLRRARFGSAFAASL